MPSKMIPFAFEIKITHFDFCYYGIYYSDKDRHNGSFFYLIFYFYRNLTDSRKHLVL